MKKKLILAVIALTLTLTLLTACNGYDATLQDITRLLKVDYSKITLNVTTTTSGVILEGIYTLTFEENATVIDYSFDKLNELSMDGDNANSYIDRVSGSARVKDGVVVDGNVAEQLPQEIYFSGLTFKQAFFENYTMTGAMFEADVKNPKAFMSNINLECTDMHVTVLYSKASLSKIAITYLSENGSDVSITYLFTK